jgi:tetratricopeptide (TPR) repeat protein
MVHPKTRRLFLRNPLKPVSLGGLFLALVFSWALVFFSITLKPYHSPEKINGDTPFTRELKNLDTLLSSSLLANPAELEKNLSRLEKKARSQEERLSVLKRRRNLARRDRRFTEAYEKAAASAAEDFSYSEAMAAVAAEAVFLNGGPLSEKQASALEAYTGRMGGDFFLPLLLSLHVLKGGFETPSRASAVPGVENLLASGIPRLSPEAGESLLADEALLWAIKGDAPAAAVRINNLLRLPSSDTPEILRMGAEFFYDHGNPLRAAELFARLPKDEDTAREADALALAGETGKAQALWRVLVSPLNDGNGSIVSGEISIRSLYNLAAASAAGAAAGAAAPANAASAAGEEKAWLEKLFAELNRPAGIAAGTPAAIFGLIRYTRIMDTPRSIAVLGGEDLRKNPFLDLELLRRRLDTWPPDKAVTETWLLLRRHPDEEGLYQWGAYFFDHQRQYAETALLLKEAANKRIAGPHLDLHRALALLMEGKTGEGEKILKEGLANGRMPPQAAWLYNANLGRVYEGRRSFSAALEYYETAAALVSSSRAPEKAALVQLRISRCYQALGRNRERRRAVEHALELDPDNFNARHELRRLDIERNSNSSY